MFRGRHCGEHLDNLLIAYKRAATEPAGYGEEQGELQRILDDYAGEKDWKKGVSRQKRENGFESIRLSIWGRLSGALLPRLEVSQKHPLHTIAKRPTDAEHCRKVVASRAGYELALVGGTGDLVQVAADVPSSAMCA